MTFEDHKRLNKAIIAQEIDRSISRGEIREHERAKAEMLTESLWTGSKGIGHAVRDAVSLIDKGLA